MKKYLSFRLIKKPFKWFRQTRRRNKIITVVAVIIGLVIISNIVQSTTAPSPYTLEKVKRENLTQVISETGNVSTAARVDVYSTTTGVIEEIYVDNGMYIEEEQNLFKVRSTATPQEKAAANAAYQNALSSKKAAEQAKLTTDAQMWQAHQALLEARNTVNYKNNHSQNPATGNDYTQLEKESIDAAVIHAEKNFQSLETKVKESDVAISAANAQVTSAQVNLQATKDMVVTSPTHGTIANLSVFTGDQVVAGGATSLASSATSVPKPVLTIANLNDYSVRVFLNEVDIPKVNSGQKASITLDALDNQRFRGTVAHVDEVGTNTQGVVTYTVLVTIDNPDSAIRPGMTASIDIVVDQVSHVLTVPNNAVKPYKGGRAVRIVDKKTKKLVFVPVEIGIKGETRTQIVKGVTEGQEIVTALSNDQIQRSSLF